MKKLELNQMERVSGGNGPYGMREAICSAAFYFMHCGTLQEVQWADSILNTGFCN